MILIAPPVAVVALLLPAPAVAAEAWRWPVRGEVVRSFAVAPERFAPGQHRGIDIAARPGDAVRAACGGRVRFAGRVPQRGRAVSVACGRFVATHLGLASTSVRREDVVVAGGRIGAAAGPVQLGARRGADRFGYVDPLKLLGSEAPPPLGAAPRGAPRGGRVASASPPHVAELRGGWAAAPASADRAAVEGSADARPGAPVVAWVGLALLLAGVPVGAVMRSGRRKRMRVRAPAARTR